MLTAETKRHIDSARQVLVGKVPNPISQVQEITNALVYKFMDDMDERSASMGGKRRYFVDDYEKFSWRKLMDPKVGYHERISLYTEALSRMSKNPNLPELFRGIFRNAYLSFNDGRTLSLFLNEINYFNYHHSEELGNAYEYLLSIMGSQGDAGQFRTPRHIIDFIVEVLDPDKDDTVLDPACGTAGFLISAYKHVMAKYDGKNDSTGEQTGEEKLLTSDEKKKLHKSYRGFDIDDNMVKMAQVNMYLHGFPEPDILIHDTLSSEDYWQDRYDVIMANPPFMTPKGGSIPHSKFGIKSNRSEVLFVDYIMSHLKPNGRAGIIVPEGIIFQSGIAYKELRKNLVNDGLYAVVSLPSGVFNPYAGVKTSILLFNNELAKQTDEILFLKIENDGYGLGAQRKQIDKNDLPQALEILKEWNRSQTVTEQSMALAVNKSKIAEDGDYKLSGYRVETDYTNAKWQTVELGDVLDYEQPTNYLVHSVDYKDEYLTPVLTAGQTFILGYTDEKDGIYRNDLPVIIFDDFTTAIKFVDFPFKVKSSAMKILKPRENVIIKYVFYAMSNINFDASTHKRYWLSQYSKIKIPLPPLEIQKQIVAELDGYQKIIDGAKQIVNNWKPKIDIDPEWERVKLGDVCTMASGGTPSKSNDAFWEGEIPWVSSKDMKVDFLADTEDHISELAVKESATKLVEKDTLLGVVRSGILQHTFPIALTTSQMCHNQDIVSFVSDKAKLDIRYLFYTFKAENEKIIQEGIKPGVTVQSFHSGFFKEYLLPLPPLEIQKQIVEKIEAERSLVESSKKLIDIYEQKSKEMIAKLWGSNT